MSQFYNNAIFWVEVDKIKPNPFQPRKEFDEAKLNDLAKSIRQYGVIQPLTVNRIEVLKNDGGLAAEYAQMSAAELVTEAVARGGGPAALYVELGRRMERGEILDVTPGAGRDEVAL